jgi:flavoprotein
MPNHGQGQDATLGMGRAASEVVRMYRQDLKLPKTARVFGDTTASAAPVGLFYHEAYHTLIVALATSNTVANASSEFQIRWLQTYSHRRESAASQPIRLRHSA